MTNMIHTCSRAQAIADGTLVDVTTTAREAGITFPVAVTRAVWEDCIAWTDADTDRTGALQDQEGRLWDVVWMTRVAIKASAPTNRITVKLHRVPRTGRINHDRMPPLVELVAVCGPGDNAEPVITIMQPGED